MNTIPTPNTSATPLSFNFATQAVRLVLDEHREPWFCAKDVCDILGYANDSDALKKHCRPEGVAKRYPLTAGGRQEMTFISEGNLFRLILRSRKPEAQRFEALVCDEILPAIRRTGQYVAPAATGSAPELLESADMTNLTRLVWLMTHNMRRHHAWAQGVWRCLRAATGTVSPSRFEVRHLPALAAEIRRLYAITHSFNGAVHDAECAMIKRVLQHRGEDADQVLAEMRRDLMQAGAEDAQQTNGLLARWAEMEIADLLRREPPDIPSRYPGFEERLG